MADTDKHAQRRARIDALSNHPQMPADLVALLHEFDEALGGDSKSSSNESEEKGDGKSSKKEAK